MFRPTRQRVLASIVLAAGAAASIATSQVQWDLTDDYQLAPVVLDEATPSVGFQVHVEYTGAIAMPEGSLSVNLSVEREPLASMAGSLRIVVTDDDTGELVVDSPFAFDLQITEPQGAYTSLDPWDGCTDGCSRDYTVWIERTDPITDAAWPQLRITGTIEAFLAEYGGASEPPAGTTMSIEVTPIEAAP